MKTGWILPTAFMVLLSLHSGFAATGEIKWQIPGRFAAGPTLGTNGLVYATGLDDRVFAWESASGQSRWVTNLSTFIYQSYGGPVVGPEGHVYVNTVSGLYALDGETGRVLWTAAGYGRMAVGPDGTVFFGASPLRALDPTTGSTRWTAIEFGNPSANIAPGANGLIFVVYGAVTALDTRTGDQAWVYNEPSTSFNSVVVAADGTLVAGNSLGHLVAFESGSGRVLWRSQGTGRISDVIIGPEGVVYANYNDVTHDEDAIYFRDLRTGEIQKRFVLDDAVVPNLAFSADGTLHLTLHNSAENVAQLLALNAATGETNWVLESADTSYFEGLNVGADGTLYVRSSSLIAVHGSSPLLDGPWPKADQNPQNNGFWRTYGPPKITGQPRSLSVTVGNPASFHFYTPIMRPVQIQWRKNGVPISRATNEGLTIDYASLSDIGSYSVAVTNEFGGDVSDEASLFVGYGLHISTFGPGTVERVPDLEVYPVDSVVELTAVTARSNYIFVEWSGDVTGTDRTVTVTLDRDYFVNATFEYLFPDAKWYSYFDDAPALGTNGALYAYSGGVLVSLEMATGKTNWQASYFDGWWAPAAIGADGTPYAGDYGGNSIWAFDPITGGKTWAFEVGVCVHACPAIGLDGTLYLSGVKLFAVDPVTHGEKWSFQGGATFESSPAISAEGVVYVGCYDRKMYALDAFTGTKFWEFTTGGGIYSSPALGADSTVYFGSLDGKVYALNGSTGAKRWEYRTGDAVWASAVVGRDGSVYIGSRDGKVYALDGETGALKWAFDAEGQVQATGALAEDGTLYISCQAGRLYALDTQTGRKLWDFVGADGTPAIGPDGTIYCAGFALPGTSPLAKSPWPKFHRDNSNTGRAHARPFFDRAGTRRTADGVELVIYSERGEQFHLESSADLETWESIGTYTTESGALKIVRPVDNEGGRFYRTRTIEH